MALATVVCTRGFSLAAAAVLHVSASDPACGGKTPCFTSIQADVKVAEGGDTVEIQPGVYREKILDWLTGLDAAIIPPGCPAAQGCWREPVGWRGVREAEG